MNSALYKRIISSHQSWLDQLNCSQLTSLSAHQLISSPAPNACE